MRLKQSLDDLLRVYARSSVRGMNQVAAIGSSGGAVKRMASRAFQLVSCAAFHWNSDNASTRGAALAFYCAFSLAPLLVIVLTLAGWIVGTQDEIWNSGAPQPSGAWQ